MTALLIGYAVAITIVFFASRTFSINRPRHTHVSGENTLPQSTRQVRRHPPSPDTRPAQYA